MCAGVNKQVISNFQSGTKPVIQPPQNVFSFFDTNTDVFIVLIIKPISVF